MLFNVANVSVLEQELKTMNHKFLTSRLKQYETTSCVGNAQASAFEILKHMAKDDVGVFGNPLIDEVAIDGFEDRDFTEVELNTIRYAAQKIVGGACDRKR